MGRSIVEAIESLHFKFEAITVKGGNYHYPHIANRPVETVLAFNNDERIHLVDNGKGLHFSSEGVLTDLEHNALPGSKVLTTFPVQSSDFNGTVQWPVAQQEPWTSPPLDQKNTTQGGFSKQAYFFGKDDYFVTVGPSLPKITKVKGGGAEFWVGSIGVFTQGGGVFEHVRGVSTYVGSAYLPNWPDNPNDQLKLLKAGFAARIGTFFKFVSY
jgi:hypothetical protein